MLLQWSFKWFTLGSQLPCREDTDAVERNPLSLLGSASSSARQASVTEAPARCLTAASETPLWKSTPGCSQIHDFCFALAMREFPELLPRWRILGACRRKGGEGCHLRATPGFLHPTSWPQRPLPPTRGLEHLSTLQAFPGRPAADSLVLPIPGRGFDPGLGEVKIPHVMGKKISEGVGGGGRA